MKISVITPIYNSEEFLEENLSTLYGQSFKNFEHIIFDNFSTDRSRSIVEKYADHRTKYYIKKDRGIFEGLNNCLNKVSGNLIFLYCSDDFIVNKDLFYEVSRLYNSNFDVISFPINIINKKNNSIIRRWAPPKKKNSLFLPPHTGMFIGSEFKDIRFDLKYKISSDFKYLRKIIINPKINYKTSSFPSVAMRNDGNSTKLENFIQKSKEDIKILGEDNFFYSLLYPLKILSKLNQLF